MDIPTGQQRIFRRDHGNVVPLSRRESDYCIECSEDGTAFRQMRICHLWNGGGEIAFGIYACSPEDSSFRAKFTDLTVGECRWKAHE